MYRPNEPHGVDTTTVPAARARTSTTASAFATQPILKTGAQKLHLMNEALARARMRELWRYEHRHRRRAADVIRDVRRRNRMY